MCIQKLYVYLHACISTSTSAYRASRIHGFSRLPSHDYAGCIATHQSGGGTNLAFSGWPGAIKPPFDHNQPLDSGDLKASWLNDPIIKPLAVV